MNNIVYIVTHVSISGDSDIAGPAHTIVEHLSKRNIPFIFIRHSLMGRRKTFITQSVGAEQKSLIITAAIDEPEMVKRLMEGVTTLRYLWHMHHGKAKSIYIGVDPLNSYWGYLLKKFKKITTLIVFSPDYSTWRYANRLINSLYYYLDRLTVRSAEVVAAVSDRILRVRQKQGIDAKRLLCIPNSPSVATVKKYRNANPNPNRLIMVGILRNDPQFAFFLKAVRSISKSVPKIHVTIVGIGPGEVQIRKLIASLRMKKLVTVKKPMSHERLFACIAQHGIGVALYADDLPLRYYCDSMKARDYLALGLPTIITGDTGTSEEIQKSSAGLWVDQTPEAIKNAILTLISDKGLYQKFHSNALLLAKLRDSDKAVKKLINFDA